LWPVDALVLVLGLLFAWLEDLKRAHEGLIDRHHSSGVIELSAVVWRGEQRDELALREELVSILDDLVSSADQVEIVAVQELGDHVRPECEADPAVIFSPPLNILIWIRPEEVA